MSISQPALSRAILTLEERLSVKLLTACRADSNRRPMGASFCILNRGKGILRDVHLMERDIQMLHSGGKGILQIGCGPLPAATFATPVIARLYRRYPKITVKLTIGLAPYLVTRLRDRSIDFFVTETDIVAEDRQFEVISMPQQQGIYLILLLLQNHTQIYLCDNIFHLSNA